MHAPTAFDIIGDIHGYAEQLEQLLKDLGYNNNSGVYSHPEERRVFFVGDFIDRGPKIRETLAIVKAMCDAGTALAVMGNHEFNAICYHTPDPANGKYFRERGEAEINQHAATVDAFIEHPDEWNMYLRWFETLPFWYETEAFRVVHAYWSDEHIATLKESFNGFTTEFLAKATDKDSKPKEYEAIEALLKGVEATLPGGHFFKDKDGHERTECRVRWWAPLQQRQTFNDFYFHCPETLQQELVPADMQQQHLYKHDKPVFFGHYWLRPPFVQEHDKAICLDYSVAKDGMLVGWRVDTCEVKSVPVN